MKGQYLVTRMINDLFPLVKKGDNFPPTFDFAWLCAVYYHKLITNTQFRETLKEMVIECNVKN